MDRRPDTATRLTTIELPEQMASLDSTRRDSNPGLIGLSRDYLDRPGAFYRVSTVVRAAGEAIAWVAGEACRLALDGPFEDGCDLPRNIIHAGIVESGTIPHIRPERAAFSKESRCVPGDSPYRHVDRMRAWIAETEPTACDRSIRRLTDRLLV